jgi:hypothetical protein
MWIGVVLWISLFPAITRFIGRASRDQLADLVIGTKTRPETDTAESENYFLF